MSSYPEHEKNITEIIKLNIDIDSIDFTEDPYESWDYDTLTYLVTELVDVIKELKSINKHTKG